MYVTSNSLFSYYLAVGIPDAAAAECWYNPDSHFSIKNSTLLQQNIY